MNPGNQPSSRSAQPAQAGINLDDIYFILFRRKWLIVSFLLLGLAGALGVKYYVKPTYVSQAKVILRYIVDAKPGVTASQDEKIISPADRGENLLNSEAQILTSWNVAQQTALLAGPEKLAPKELSGEAALMSAAGVISGGLEVEIPRRNEVIFISFRHRDPQLVQPVLNSLIDTYVKKHLEVHQGIGVLDDYYASQRDALKKKLGDTEEELKQIMARAELFDLDEAKGTYFTQIRAIKDEIFKAQTEITERRAALSDEAILAFEAAATNSAEEAVPPAKLDEYTLLLSEIDTLKKRERGFLGQYTRDHPSVQAVLSQIQEIQSQKAAMENEFPGLAGLDRISTNASGVNVALERAKITELARRVTAFGSMLSNVQAQAMSLVQLGPEIEKLQRQRDEDRRNYERYVESVKNAQLNADLGLGKITNFSIVQTPSPPRLDNEFMMKLLFGVLGGCVGAGFGLAFLLELVFNRTLRRPSDVQRHLGMRLVLTIPDQSLPSGSGSRLRLPWLGRNGKSHVKAHANGEPEPASETSLAPWDSGHHLWAFAEALRDRLVTYFEIHNLTHKPKLVGVTSCGGGAGVSTIASGLAAALSETGDGNVLLVDMNMGPGAAHAFYKGKPACGVGEVLEPSSRADAQVHENLYLASMQGGNGDLLPKVLPKRFMHLVPKLKASDYDYIIFDMPPITQTSVTPRLAGHMDMVLMVLEAEKTGQQLANKAGELLTDSRANVAAVLNKYHRYLPAGLSQEL